MPSKARRSKPSYGGRSPGRPGKVAEVSQKDFVALVKELGPRRTAERLGCSETNVYHRRRVAEKELGPIAVKDGRTRVEVRHAAKLDLSVQNGVVLVGSDSHYWPGQTTTAHRAFVKFCQDLKPVAVIKNGDELDGASISRHAPIGWEERPKLIDEIETVKARLGEIEKAAPKAQLFWPLGNHDARFETRLATVAPEYAKVHGVHLKDHFPEWAACWMVEINGSVVIKHRFRSGIHATHNNVVNAGKTIVTGHLHSLKVTPFTDYNGTRWGIDCGTMADPDGPVFQDYTELNPKNWRSGFVVLTFVGGELCWPEVVWVRDEKKGIVEFRGERIRV